MNKNLSIALAVAASGILGLSQSAIAQNAIIEVTGATAFRQGALDAIRARFIASGSPYTIRWQGTGVFNASTRAIFRGNFQTSDGDPTNNPDPVLTDIMIRTSFTGSTDGLRALDLSDYSTPGADGVNPATYLPTTTIPLIAAVILEANGATNTPAAADSDFSFSDVNVNLIPPQFIDGSDFLGGNLGVVTFTPIVNDGNTLAASIAPEFGNLTNVTSQNFRRLFTAGRLPLSLFTGNSTHTNRSVVASGRNDGSGTRAVYTSETGIGLTTVLQQFVADQFDSTIPSGFGNGVITRLRQAPVVTNITAIDARSLALPAVNVAINGAAPILGDTTNGNGGYVSGGLLSANLLPYTSKSTQIVNAAGTFQIAAAAPVAVLTVLSTADAIAPIAAGARAVGYNGVSITPAGPLSPTDRDKVVYGQYTFWSFQTFYGKDLDANEQSFSDTLFAEIGAVIEANGTGISLTAMQVGRVDIDGSTVISAPQP